MYFDSAELLQDEDSEGNFQYTLTASTEQYACASDDNAYDPANWGWRPSVITLSGTASFSMMGLGLKTIFNIFNYSPGGTWPGDADGPLLVVPPGDTCAFDGVTYSYSAFCDRKYLSPDIIFDGYPISIWDFDGIARVVDCVFLEANRYYFQSGIPEPDGSSLVYEISNQDLDGQSQQYIPFPIGKVVRTQTGGTTYTTHYLSAADALSQLQANSWEFTGARVPATDPTAEYTFKPERADVTKLQYSIQIQPGTTKLVLWQETFTPAGASQPSDVRWMSWNPGTDDTQSPTYLIDPLEAGNPHRFPDQPGTYNVVLVSTYSELAVDANYDGRVELGTEGTSDQTSVDNPYHFLLDDEADSADTGAAVSGPHALSVSGDRTAPGSLKRARSTVNGIDDLKNFFPVFLSIKEPVINIASSLATYSPSTPVQYVLKQDDGALEFVYTDLTRASAYDYLNGTRTNGFGPSFDQAPTSATIQQLTAGGVPLPQTFLDRITNQGGGIILVNGLLTSAKPLYVQIFLGETSLGRIPLQLSPMRAELAVDANHDGAIKLATEDGSDATSADKPFVFWLNDNTKSGDVKPNNTTVQLRADGNFA